MVERYLPGVDPLQISLAQEQICRAVDDLARRGTRVRVVSSTFIPADEVVLTVFEATRKTDVIEVHKRSGVRFDRLQPVEVSQSGCKEI